MKRISQFQSYVFQKVEKLYDIVCDNITSLSKETRKQENLSAISFKFSLNPSRDNDNIKIAKVINLLPSQRGTNPTEVSLFYIAHEATFCKFALQEGKINN